MKEVRVVSRVTHAYREEREEAGGVEESTGVREQTGSWYPAPSCTSLGWDPPGCVKGQAAGIHGRDRTESSEPLMR